MISCGAQCLTCDFPIHMDTYKGCEHLCKYCSVRRKYAIGTVSPLPSVTNLRNFIKGKRNRETWWCDWGIPLHWGANSDPFQPCEKEHRVSLECLRVFAESKYPFIVSTKNPVLLTEEPYFSVLSECNAVLQISMACGRYDKLETGAPTFEERLKAAEILAPKVRRVIARIQPFFPDAIGNILAELPRYKQAGIQGVIVSGFVSPKKQKGMIRDGGSYIFPLEKLAPLMKRIKAKCHECGLEFTCSNAGLTFLSDSPVCCGCAGLDDFKANTFHLEHLAEGNAMSPTAAMCNQPCPQPFKCIMQTQAWAKQIQGRTFSSLMLDFEYDFTEQYQEQKRLFGEG